MNLPGYDANDERFWSYNVANNDGFWRIRGLGNEVLREFINGNAGWRFSRDSIYRGSTLLSQEERTSAGIFRTRHLHPDHLGTPRIVTDSAGNVLERHHYYPFGREATSITNTPDPMRFTGHERDFNGGTLSDNVDYFDYMHARYYSPALGRFLALDGIDGSAQWPQSWNRYAYVSNRPVVFRDPSGLITNRFNEEITVEGRDPLREAHDRASQLWNLVQRKLHREPRAALSGAGSLVRGVGRSVFHLARETGVLGNEAQRDALVEKQLLLAAERSLLRCAGNDACRNVIAGALLVAAEEMSDDERAISGAYLAGRAGTPFAISVATQSPAGFGVGALAIAGDLRHAAYRARVEADHTLLEVDAIVRTILHGSEEP